MEEEIRTAKIELAQNIADWVSERGHVIVYEELMAYLHGIIDNV